MRVVPDGSGCEVVFTLRPPAKMSDEDFALDADAVKVDPRRPQALAGVSRYENSSLRRATTE
jgi:hypothetical protein